MVLVIAEAGVNHNGKFENAIKLIDSAKDAGADIIKFQTFKTELSLSKNISKADYQVNNTGEGTQYEMVKALELTFEEHKRLKQYCDSLGIEYLSTAFDLESLNFLINDLELQTLKIASGEITNSPLLLAHARSGCDLIVSTGMCTLGDIEYALGVIAYGLMKDDTHVPNNESFRLAYYSEDGQKLLKEKVTLLHCTTEYPAPFEEINLRAMTTLKKAFNLQVGYSDHSQGITVPILSVAFKASVIEKHFTLDKTMDGPDHIASLEPQELKEMVLSIKEAEKALGESSKKPTPSELKNSGKARKFILAATKIKKGDLFTSENVSIKRGRGYLKPSDYWELLGKVALRDYEIDDGIDLYS